MSFSMTARRQLFRERRVARFAFLRERETARLRLLGHELLSWSHGHCLTKKGVVSAGAPLFVFFIGQGALLGFFVALVLAARGGSFFACWAIAGLCVFSFFALVSAAIVGFRARRRRKAWLASPASSNWLRQRDRIKLDLASLRVPPAELRRLDEACSLHKAASGRLGFPRAIRAVSPLAPSPAPARKARRM